ncbi:P-loop containing nucleoside triphosphate hydrolase protein [Annulohypoxylon maeteangense]|uniref:P-loop containing nucleoside triphosphate hydrolase protein n=1 Tax=Annulohypoxylon maeteangense TaxID=1927788 RepID=UPI002007ED17|nr:P-loop containing nucleoside triphosphate hydrolase protein [Annulohypoxylon maeteangense]KAI0883339.1 P-loop containing nucleoside triphosphate hydrolase protein [Annulohypoxylon maeteangense]
MSDIKSSQKDNVRIHGLEPARVITPAPQNQNFKSGIFASRAGPYGFSLEFPLGDGQVNEDVGIGARYTRDARSEKTILTKSHNIQAYFPRGHTTITVQRPGIGFLVMFPNEDLEQYSFLSIHLQGNSQITVNGFGIPFDSPDSPHIEGLVNGGVPLSGESALVDLLQQRDFYFYVACPAHLLAQQVCLDNALPSRYPYGQAHTWNEALYKEQAKNLKSSKAFSAAYSFENDNDHLAAITQSTVQDCFWLELAANQIAANHKPGFFASIGGVTEVDGSQIRYLIFLHEGMISQFKAAWQRLTKEAQLQVEIFEDYHDGTPLVKWDCEVLSHPETVAALRGHPINGSHELVLAVRVPPQKDRKACDMKVFSSYAEAHEARVRGEENWNCVSLRFGSQLDDCERKVNSICMFSPGSGASNPRAIGLLESHEMGNEARMKKLVEVEDKMDLHRALLRGNGFFQWMTRSPATDVVTAMEAVSLQSRPKFRPLPTVNFLETGDSQFIDSLMMELLPEDRNRFRRYLSCRPLGLGLITAGPGHAKTTMAAVSALIMQAKFGYVLCSGPTNVAVSNFAERIERISISTYARLNEGKSPDDPSYRRRKLVVRAYKNLDEISAMIALLRRPDAGDRAIENDRSPSASRWRLHLSFAYWVHVLLRSRASGIRQLDSSDCQGLHDLRLKIDKCDKMRELRAVATGKMSWNEYAKLRLDTKSHLVRIFADLIGLVDMLCTTPAMTANVRPYSRWKAEKAQCVAVDEAANMHRADLYTVWGNTLLPCFLAGDPYQLPPAVMTQSEKDGEGNLINRFASTGRISALEFLQASGMPVFRMRVQLRMARGLFDTVSRAIYDMPARYHDCCDITHDRFKAGRMLESYVLDKYKSVIPSEEGKLSPVFIHCDGTKVSIDPTTGSKKSVDQVTVALDFVADLVKATTTKTEQIIILAPYAANVELLRNMLKTKKYASLSGMDQPSTIDGYQGQEKDIVVVVMGTRAGKPGPGFTSDERRLNVLLTRQRCGLVIVGDIDVVGAMGPYMHGVSGSVYGRPVPFHLQGPLRTLHIALCRSGRVAKVKVNDKALPSTV